jgi:UDP-glucose 4-epimerase
MILVTGGAGYIGSNTVLALREAGERIIVLDDLSTGSRAAVPEGVQLVVGDIADRELVQQLIHDNGVTAIIHFAAKIVVPDSVADPLGYYASNTIKAHALLSAAVDSGVKAFIFSSTAAVYGEPEMTPLPEDAPLRPMSPYGRSKLMVEDMLRDSGAAYGLPYVVLRYFNVAGADPLMRAGQTSPNATHLIKVAAETALGKRPQMQVFGTDYDTPDGSCIRDYIHVTDLAAAHVLALRHLRSGGESLTLNCGYGKGYSVLEVLDSMRRVSQVDLRATIGPRRPGDPSQIVAAAEQIRRLGWRPRFDSLDTITTHALQWERLLADR